MPDTWKNIGRYIHKKAEYNEIFKQYESSPLFKKSAARITEYESMVIDYIVDSIETAFSLEELAKKTIEKFPHNTTVSSKVNSLMEKNFISTQSGIKEMLEIIFLRLDEIQESLKEVQ